MKQNKLRYLLNNDQPSVATRLWTTWPFFVEAVGSTGNYDYIEYEAEYSPFSQYDLENIARAAELSDMGTMIKIDFQNRGYVAQKAIGSGFQSIMFTDCQGAADVRESVYLVKPETPKDGGRFGYPNRRFIGFQPRIPQMDHATRQREIVLSFMIEKASTVDEIEAICSISGVDMIQFGPSDYCMSLGWNKSEHEAEVKTVERHVIEVALKHGVQPRCEIGSVEGAKYYIDLGVKHFCLSDEFVFMLKHWTEDGKNMRDIADSIKR